MRRHCWISVILVLLSFTVSASGSRDVNDFYFLSGSNSESSRAALFDGGSEALLDSSGETLLDNGFVAHRQRADALYRSGRYAEAFREYSAARELVAGQKSSGLQTSGMGRSGALLGSTPTFGNTFSSGAARAPFYTPQLEELDFRMALTAQRGGMEDAAVRLLWFIEQYPRSVYMPEVRYALGNFYFDRNDFTAAQQAYDTVDTSRLDREERSACYFKLGYTFFVQENFTRVYSYMRQVDEKSIYHPHAQYAIGYSDYRTGNLASARRIFSDISDMEAYASVAPFHLLQIEYSGGNYRYVMEHGPAMFSAASGSRAQEIARMVGEAAFRSERWMDAISYMHRFTDAGGAMGRTENYIAGYSYYMLRDYSLAEHYLEAVPGPDDLLSQNAAYHLGDIYIRSGEKRRAMQSFSIASVRGYDDTVSEDALFNYGKLQYELGGGYFNEAINVLNRYLELYPASPHRGQVREYLAAAYYNSNNFEAAYQAIMDIPNPDNNTKAALQRITYFRAMECIGAGNYSDAALLLEESLRNRYNAKYTALAGYWQGELLYRSGEYRGAAQKFEEYVRLSPKSERENTVARYNLGYCYFNLKEWERSREWFDSFKAAHGPSDSFLADTDNRLGDIEYAGRAFWRAIEFYDSAANVGSAERYYSAFRRAMTLGMLERTEGKIDGLLRIIDAGKGPYVPDAVYQLGRTYMVQQKFRQAAQMLEIFIEDYPASPEYISALADLGLVYQNLNDYDKALECYKKVVEAERHSQAGRDAMNGIRSIYVEQNRVGDYFAYAHMVGIETDLDVVQRDSLTFVAAQRTYQSGNKVQAEQSLADYIEKYPQGVYVPNALYYRAEIAFESGLREVALDYFGQVAAMQSTPYTVAALEKTALLAMELKKFPVAADAYDRLSRNPAAAAGRDDALAGYMGALIYGGDLEKIVEAADDVASRTDSKSLVRETRYTKAVALERLGRGQEAIDIFRELSGDVSNPQGAESAYRVIEALWQAGDSEGAEKAVYDFAGKNTPYAKWLGKAFLILGDIYVARGDSFQARATFQSLVDGYPDKEDGIVSEARQRIKNL